MNLITRTAACAALLAAGFGLATGTANATVHGDPDAARPYWSHQTLDDCMLMAVADVVGQATGQAPTEDQIVDVATATKSHFHPGPVYTVPADVDDPATWGDVRAEDSVVLLAHYGIAATYTDDDVSTDGGPATGLPALEGYLDRGEGIVVYVNSATIWNEDGDRSSSDHAVVVTAVDTDADGGRGIVHLNDSGPDDGCDEQVSIATFEAAWRAGGHGMTVTG
ncbi:hypothetical protein JRC04_27500 [Mycolicibacterium sp. S2-37]|uniref:hypothetical protein n=1 Tax=Mycolicibacterium sp. S2-37 TaxID=2810297 RepID=UPI001A941FAC|nr:hypothetical protein [Mycolicibacterium sp. S2-37]MBO0679828.1 hypothetical protein [Mycolicibacterium sp. S2-37]MBO0681225.1 hypothetical protein [Mycolicibacterium sp. S2-37]